MLPANELVTFLIKSAMLRALRLHPIKISHFIVNGTHIHMIIRVWNPEDVPGFMERFKTELSHYLNNLVGRNKKTIWSDGYDSPAIILADDVIDKIVYLYTNPVKDGLIDSINHYPGLSSWSSFNNRKSHIKGRLICRDDVVEVDQNGGSEYFYKKKRILSLAGGKEKIIPI